MIQRQRWDSQPERAGHTYRAYYWRLDPGPGWFPSLFPIIFHLLKAGLRSWGPNAKYFCASPLTQMSSSKRCPATVSLPTAGGGGISSQSETGAGMREAHLTTMLHLTRFPCDVLPWKIPCRSTNHRARGQLQDSAHYPHAGPLQAWAPLWPNSSNCPKASPALAVSSDAGLNTSHMSATASNSILKGRAIFPHILTVHIYRSVSFSPLVIFLLNQKTPFVLAQYIHGMY